MLCNALWYTANLANNGKWWQMVANGGKWQSHYITHLNKYIYYIPIPLIVIMNNGISQIILSL
jgi:hypothetical protein